MLSIRTIAKRESNRVCGEDFPVELRSSAPNPVFSTHWHRAKAETEPPSGRPDDEGQIRIGNHPAAKQSKAETTNIPGTLFLAALVAECKGSVNEKKRNGTN